MNPKIAPAACSAGPNRLRTGAVRGSGGGLLAACLFAALPAAAFDFPAWKREVAGTWPGIARGGVGDLAIAGDVAYVASNGGGLLVLGLGESGRPEVLAQELSCRAAYSVEVESGCVYVGGKSGVHVFDCSDPDEPSRLGGTDSGDVRELKVWGDTLATASYEPFAINLYRIGPDHSLSALSTIAMATEPTDLELLGDYLYVGTNQTVDNPSQRVVAYDISNRADPVQVWSATSPGYNGSVAGTRLAIHKGKLYAACGTLGLRVFDLANPASPAAAGTCPETAFDVDADADGIYLAAHSSGLLDFDPGGNLVNYRRWSRARTYTVGVEAEGNWVATIDLYDGLHLFRKNTAAVQGYWNQTSCFDGLSGISHDAAFWDTRLLVADGWCGLRILDVANPAEPEELSQLTIDDAIGVRVTRGYALVAGGRHRGLTTVELRDGSDAVVLGRVATRSVCNQLELGQGMAFLAEGYCTDWSGVEAFDIADPAAPVPNGSHPTADHVYDLAVQGNRVFVPNGNGVDVLDAVPGGGLTQVGRITTTAKAEAVEADGSRCYVVTAAGVEEFKAQGGAQYQAAGVFRDTWWKENWCTELGGQLFYAAYTWNSTSETRQLGVLTATGTGAPQAAGFMTSRSSCLDLVTGADLLCQCQGPDGIVLRDNWLSWHDPRMDVRLTDGQPWLRAWCTRKGVGYWLESAADLASWTSHSRLTGTGGGLAIQLPSAGPREPRRFYRLRTNFESAAEITNRWETARDVAMQRALAEGRLVLLVTGPAGDPDAAYVRGVLCETTQPDIRGLLQAGFVLWQGSAQDGASYGGGGNPAPVIACIDPAAPAVALDLSSGVPDPKEFWIRLLAEFGRLPKSRVIALSGDLSFGTVATGDSATRLLTISNSGTRPLTVTGLTCPPGFAGNWSGTIVPGGSRQVAVVFSPPAAQSYAGSLMALSDKTGGSGAIAVSGSGTSVISRVLDYAGDLGFGTLTVGQTSTRTLTLHNTGTARLTVAGLSCPAGFNAAWSGGIEPGGSQQVTVTFAPTVEGAHDGTLAIESDKTAGADVVPLTGSAIAATRVISLPGSLAFGYIGLGQTAALPLTISNGGNAPLTVSGLTCPAGFSGTWSGSIPPGGSQVVAITFAPTSDQGYSGNLVVHSDKTAGSDTVALSGAVGTATRVIALAGTTAFGNVPLGMTATRVLTISNSGNSPLTVSGLTLPAGFSGAWSGSIGPGGSQQVTLTFAPTAVQTYSGNVTVASDKTAGTSTKALGGSGITATRILTLSQDMVFGSVAVGQSASQNLRIANDGNSPLTVSGITLPAGYSGNWSGTLAPGESRWVAIVFAPPAPGSYTGYLTVLCDKTSGANTRLLTGSGNTGG